MFNAFRRRITQGYVVLAIVLIVVIVAASSVLAFLLFSRSMNDAIAGASQRASDTAASIMSHNATLAQAAPEIAQAVGRHAFHVVVVDGTGRRLAQNEREGSPSTGRAIVIAFGRAIGLPRARVPIKGGAILISPDIDRFGALLLWYWSIMLPIGIVAVLVAWAFGRRITARAVGPLADVTGALRVIAGGDFSPQRLLEGSSDLRDLTGAYNDVAYSLATATAQRARTEAQMRQFIADAGHELRTPLTIIMGYLDALRHGIVQPDGAQRTYDTMLDESRKMRTLIEKLILLARLERAPTAPPVALDLGSVAENAVETLSPLANGRIHIERTGGPYVVTANESELHEAIKNAVDNALKYAPQSDIRVAIAGDQDHAWVEVADSGPGMDPQDAAHAFDRFYRGAARADAEGTGLGLAIAKGALERAGGSAELDTGPGRGTIVRLRLPRSKPAPD
ncbi:MAG TPA: HAMP domain-containing sensor histidine kinase, partial [Candidatus Baltobacteraceae bacterium]|nr:HAMP domain-containing sensor histidine kinase [Candidatus Baltobacteraceae bacterium]